MNELRKLLRDRMCVEATKAGVSESKGLEFAATRHHAAANAFEEALAMLAGCLKAQKSARKKEVEP